MGDMKDIKTTAISFPFEFGMNYLTGETYVRDLSKDAALGAPPWDTVQTAAYDRLLASVQAEALVNLSLAFDGVSVVTGDVPSIADSLATIANGRSDEEYEPCGVCDACLKVDAEAAKGKDEPS